MAAAAIAARISGGIASFSLPTASVAAAVVVLAAFTVELAMKIMLRRSITATLRRPS